MQVRVLFFGILRDLAGQADDSLTLPEHATLSDVLSHYQSRIPSLTKLSSSLALSINQHYASPEATLHPGDEVALLPPVSGGLERTAIAPEIEAVDCVRITQQKIDTPSLLEKIKSPADGAVLVFEGIVRDNSRGRRVRFLDYEAYEEMALKSMTRLVQQVRSRFAVREVVIVHRLGRLQIGETSVLIAVTSAHRACAFDACRWLIDTLKRTVPIWKKEYFEDGAVWADGEPFPPEIVNGESGCPQKPASK
jgi:MoaE-MoaD fusion protein